MLTIHQFAQAHGLDIVVRTRAGARPTGADDFFYARIDNADIKAGVFLSSTFGNGATPEEACRAYAKEISGQLLVVDACLSTRREIRVPELDLAEPRDTDRLRQQIDALRPLADALQKIAGILDMPAGSDVTLAVLGVRSLAAKFAGLEQAHQELLAERDEWRTYAIEARANTIKATLREKVLLDALEPLAMHCAGDELDDADVARIDAALAFAGPAPEYWPAEWEKQSRRQLARTIGIMNFELQMLRKINASEERKKLKARIAEANKAAEFNFEQYQDASRLLNAECEKSERLLAALEEVRRDVRHAQKGHFVNLDKVEEELSAAIAAAEQEGGAA